MQILSTLAVFALAVQCTVAAPERQLLRSGYDSPIDFSTLTGGGDSAAQQEDSAKAGLPGVDSLTKGLSGITGGLGGKDGLSKLLPSDLPTADALSSLTKGGDGLLPTDALSSVTKGDSDVTKMLPTDLSALTKGGALSSLTGEGGLDSITSGLTKGGALPSLPGLPIGGSGADLTKGLSSVTDKLSGVTDKLSGMTGGLGLPSTSTSTSTATTPMTNAGKHAYSSTGDQAEDKASAAEKSPDQKPVA
jgi:hypothetical protein